MREPAGVASRKEPLMTTQTVATSPDLRSTNAPRIRFGRRTRRGVLVVHIASAGAWIGIDVLLATLVATARFTASTEVAAVAYQAIGLFVLWPMFGAGALCLLSGLLLGLGTKFGLLRYWWVMVKLVMNVVLLVLVLVALRPGLGDVLAHGRLLGQGIDSGADLTTMMFPPAVSLTALTVAMVLSVFKPWGRTRPVQPRRSPRDDRPAPWVG